MNINEITSKRQGWQSNPNANATAGSVPLAAIAMTTGIAIGQQPSKPCDHNFQFLRHDACVVDQKDVFYCRRCLEYREVKR